MRGLKEDPPAYPVGAGAADGAAHVEAALGIIPRAAAALPVFRMHAKSLASRQHVQSAISTLDPRRESNLLLRQLLSSRINHHEP